MSHYSRPTSHIARAPMLFSPSFARTAFVDKFSMSRAVILYHLHYLTGRVIRPKMQFRSKTPLDPRHPEGSDIDQAATRIRQ